MNILSFWLEFCRLVFACVSCSVCCDEMVFFLLRLLRMLRLVLKVASELC